jgi:UDP-GlcNAc:undecaprenyl-phosphate GlcNAc-1-phosphate transferase
MTEAFSLAATGFVAGGIAAFAVTPVTAKLARRLGILDRPPGQDSYKRQAEPVPYLGGVAIFGGLTIGAAVPVLLIASRHPETFSRVYLPAILVAIALGVVGLWDDVRSLPRSARVVAQIGGAGAAWAIGFRVMATPWTWLNVVLTVLWIVGMTNAFNLLDNMDGLSAGLAGVGALSFAVMGVLENLSVVALVAAALAGAAIGFLAHNRHPAKVFMGDAGSLFLGFLLALIGIKLEFENLLEVTFLVPVIVLGLPIFDTTLVLISRWRHGRPLFHGGRDHVSHRLVAIGLPVKATVGLLYFAGLCLGWLGLVISRSNQQVGFMLLGFVMALALFFGFMLLKVPVYAAER